MNKRPFQKVGAFYKWKKKVFSFTNRDALAHLGIRQGSQTQIHALATFWRKICLQAEWGQKLSPTGAKKCLRTGFKLYSTVFWCCRGAAQTHQAGQLRLTPRTACLRPPGMGDWIIVYRNQSSLFCLFEQ